MREREGEGERKRERESHQAACDNHPHRIHSPINTPSYTRDSLLPAKQSHKLSPCRSTAHFWHQVLHLRHLLTCAPPRYSGIPANGREGKCRQPPLQRRTIDIKPLGLPSLHSTQILLITLGRRKTHMRPNPPPHIPLPSHTHVDTIHTLRVGCVGEQDVSYSTRRWSTSTG